MDSNDIQQVVQVSESAQAELQARRAVQATVGVPSNAIHSVVVFLVRNAFESPMPRNVTRGRDCFAYIESFRDPRLRNSQAQRVVTALRATRIAPTRRIRREHMQALTARADPSAERKCPRCGNSMVLRIAKRGSNAGNHFWGCSAHPACRVVQDL